MKNKKIVSLLMVALLLLNVYTVPNVTVLAKERAPKLTTKQVTLEIGAKKTLKVKQLEKNATVDWKSSNSKIVTVSKKGIIVAKKTGTATIKAIVKQTKKKVVLKCKVSVTDDNKNAVDTSKSALPLPLTPTQKKNNLFDQFTADTISEIRYSINDKSYVVNNQTKIAALLAYMSLLEVEPTENPNVAGGFSIYLCKPDQISVMVGLLGNKLNIDGKYYTIKNSGDITLIAQLFLGI